MSKFDEGDRVLSGSRSGIVTYKYYKLGHNHPPRYIVRFGTLGVDDYTNHFQGDELEHNPDVIVERSTEELEQRITKLEIQLEKMEDLMERFL